MYDSGIYGQGYQPTMGQADPYGGSAQPYGSPYAMAGNPGYAFLDSNMQQVVSPTSQGMLSGQFNQVMGSMAGGITQGAQQGNIPLFGGANASQYNMYAAQAQKLGVKTYGGLTLAQISQQMNTGGAASVLPYMGMNSLPQIVFPVAGLWTLYDGVKAINGMRQSAAADRANDRVFDPKQLNYNKTLEQMNAMNDEYAYMGPLY